MKQICGDLGGEVNGSLDGETQVDHRASHSLSAQLISQLLFGGVRLGKTLPCLFELSETKQDTNAINESGTVP